MLIGAAAVAFLVLLVTFPRRGVGLRGYVLGVALLVLSIGASTSAPDSVRYASIATAAVMLLIGWSFGDRTHTRKISRWVLLLWFAWSIGVSLFAERSPLSLAVLVGVPLLLVPVVSRLTAPDIRPLLRWTGLTLLLQFVIGVAELTILPEPIFGYRNLSTDGLPVIRYNPFLPGLVRIQGTTGHPIIFSLVMMTGLLLFLALGSRVSQWFRIGCVGIAGAGLLLSGTRSAFVAAAVGILVFLFFAPNTRTRLRNVLWITFAGAGVWIGDFGLSAIASEAVESDSFAHRLEGWISFDQLIHRSSPTGTIGSGFFSEEAIFAQGLLQQDGFQVIDNHLIWTLAVSGVVGLVGMVGVFAMSWFESDRLGKAQIALMLTMSFSFDLLTWLVSASLFVLAVALPRDLVQSADIVPLRRVLNEQQANSSIIRESSRTRYPWRHRKVNAPPLNRATATRGKTNAVPAERPSDAL